MYKYVNGSLKVEAQRWFKDGDHDKVVMVSDLNKPYIERTCNYCDEIIAIHGWIDTSDGSGFIVCPGDYIVSYQNGDLVPVKPDLFELTYELMEFNND